MIFSNTFWRFTAVSLLVRLLFDAFEAQTFRLFQLCLWLAVWSKKLSNWIVNWVNLESRMPSDFYLGKLVNEGDFSTL